MNNIKNKIYHIAANIDEPLYSFLIYIHNNLELLIHPEKIEKRSGGADIYYIISLCEEEIGLASYYDKVIGYMLRAYKKGWTPIVDLSDKKNALYDFERGGNPWLYFFTQKDDISNINDKYNVIKCNRKLITVYKRLNKREINNRFRISKKVEFNKNTMAFIKRHSEDILNEKKDVIGAYYRGTDYKCSDGWNPMGHPVSPPINEFCCKLQNYCENYKLKNIFFMTDEGEALDYAKRFFSDYDFRYIEHPRYYNFKYGNSVSTMTPDGISKTENNLYYLTDIYILSKCTNIVSTMNSGTIMALNLNGNQYEHIDILDFGRS